MGEKSRKDMQLSSWLGLWRSYCLSNVGACRRVHSSAPLIALLYMSTGNDKKTRQHHFSSFILGITARICSATTTSSSSWCPLRQAYHSPTEWNLLSRHQEGSQGSRHLQKLPNGLTDEGEHSQTTAYIILRLRYRQSWDGFHLLGVCSDPFLRQND